jgi:octaprenyl-diphosphate synthase
MSFASVKTLVDDDLQEVDRVIRTRLASDVVLINQIAEYIVGSGGKRLRPLVVLVAGRACGNSDVRNAQAAAIIEFIHTATLLHDDVVDGSTLRRGRETANEVWGNEASVLVGDYVYSRSFEMMVSLGSMRVMDVMAGATNKIAEGEVLQLLNANDADTTQERYFEVIYRKTAKLFESGAQIAAILAGAPAAIEGAMARYGRHLGTAFQLIDDVLDYHSDSEQLGKNLGDDLAEGKPTLPLIHVMRTGSSEQAALVRRAIIEGGRDAFDGVLAAIRACSALDYAREAARREAEAAARAIAPLPASEFKQSLLELASFSVTRSS